MTAVNPLPICPRPVPGEALRSWLSRVGHVYRLTAEGLAFSTQLLETMWGDIEDIDLVQVADLARLPLARIRSLRAGPIDWMLHERSLTVVCFRCLAGDSQRSEPLHGRAVWRQAWRIYCPRHSIRLESIATRRVFPRRRFGLAGRQSTERVRQFITARAETSTLDATAPPTHAAIRSMESAITDALAGCPPRGALRSSLSSREFLRVVTDLTTWALSNFEDFAAHPVAANPPAPRVDDRRGVFHALVRPLPPVISPRSRRTLRETLYPGRRAGALWWTYALMANAGPATMLRGDPIERQHTLLAGRTPAGLDWLRQQVSAWPDLYRRANWIDLESLLAPDPFRHDLIPVPLRRSDRNLGLCDTNLGQK